MKWCGRCWALLRDGPKAPFAHHRIWHDGADGPATEVGDPVPELRDRITALPASQRLVVLSALIDQAEEYGADPKTMCGLREVWAAAMHECVAD